MGKVDYIIRGGHVIDCYQGISKQMDIAVKDGKIVDAENAEAVHEIDAAGCIVTPGLIDFHTHIGAFVTELGIVGEASYFPNGVTSVVDAGSTGTSNYEAFRILSAQSRLRIKAYLNVSPAGLVTTAYHENVDPDHYQKEKLIRLLKKYPDQLLGFKIRQSKEIVGDLGTEPERAMIEIAEEAGCPVVVHTTNPPRDVDDIAKQLRPGDVYAHVYQGKGKTVVEDGKVRPEFFEYQKKGIIFDAANGTNHFSLDVAQKCLEQGFLPDVISTDLTTKSAYIPGKVFSLPFIMSKYMALGLPMEKIIECTTLTPARLMKEEKEIGSLCAGTCADIAIHRVIPHETVFEDCFGKKLQGDSLLKTELTMREGNVVYRQIDF